MKVSFAKKIEKENALLITGTTDIGVECYYYIKPLRHKVEELLKMAPGTQLNINDFGELIERGYGEPPDNF